MNRFERPTMPRPMRPDGGFFGCRPFAMSLESNHRCGTPFGQVERLVPLRAIPLTTSSGTQVGRNKKNGAPRVPTLSRD